MRRDHMGRIVVAASTGVNRWASTEAFYSEKIKQTAGVYGKNGLYYCGG